MMVPLECASSKYSDKPAQAYVNPRSKTFFFFFFFILRLTYLHILHTFIPCVSNGIQSNLNNSNPDGSFTMVDSNLLLSPYKFLLIAP